LKPVYSFLNMVPPLFVSENIYFHLGIQRPWDSLWPRARDREEMESLGFGKARACWRVWCFIQQSTGAVVGSPPSPNIIFFPEYICNALT
jgi:hypothetical protein